MISMGTNTNTQPTIKTVPVIAKFLLGFALIYGTLELLARLLGDVLRLQNALLITGAVLAVALLVEVGLLSRNWRLALRQLGLGWSGWPALGVALLIALFQLAVYPLITGLTGYHWTLPSNWPWTMVGIFALHGVAEEVLYRAFLFGHLRAGRSFWRAAWLAVLLFTLSHLPILASQGLVVGGAAVMLSIASSFPFDQLYAQGRNTIWAPALVHGAVDTVIPLLATGGMADGGQVAALIWMGVAMVLPYLAFLFPRKNLIEEAQHPFS